MSESLIDACLTALHAPPDGGLPGLLVRTTLDRFELLQTPGLWGHDPADNSYWIATAGGPAPLPSESGRLLAAIEEVIAGAESFVDIASLEPLASGAFAAAVRRGLARAASRSPCGSSMAATASSSRTTPTAKPRSAISPQRFRVLPASASMPAGWRRRTIRRRPRGTTRRSWRPTAGA